MAEKVTIMKLKVDLQCCKCYKKVKKILCKFPQIRDQVYDEKQNIVTITVVCCSPEKIRDKLCCKGGGTIKSIEIVEPPKPKPPEPEKPKPEKPIPEKQKEKPPEPKPEAPPAPKPASKPPEPKPEAPKQKPPEPKPEAPKQKPPEPKPEAPSASKPAAPAPKQPEPAPVPVCPPAPPPMAVPIGICCVPCYEGRPGGPCFEGYGRPPPCYDGYYGRPVYDSYGGGRPYYVSRCDQYFSEENATGCTIM